MPGCTESEPRCAHDVKRVLSVVMSRGGASQSGVPHRPADGGEHGLKLRNVFWWASRARRSSLERSTGLDIVDLCCPRLCCRSCSASRSRCSA